MLGLVFMILSYLYGLLIIFSYFKSKVHGVIRIIALIGSLLLIISNIGIITLNIKYVMFAIIGVFLINSSSLINGYKMFGKPHWKHHIIKGIFSIVMIFMYILYLI